MKLQDLIRPAVFAGLLGMVCLVGTGATDAWFDPTPVAAQTTAVPWTSVGSAGIADESNLGFTPPVFAFSGAMAGYNPASPSVAPIQFRYNVTNTYDNGSNPNRPGWVWLEAGLDAPATSVVQAQLKRVDRCTGAETTICYIYQTNTPAGGVCPRCTITQAVDFTGYLYYVDVVLDRNTPSEYPRIKTLRLIQ